eukprot:241488-Prymnesium_polylepis.1
MSTLHYATCRTRACSVASELTLRPAMPPKRAAPDDATTEENKKFRSALDSMADEWVCPITFELPLDPVIAEDG